MKFILFALFFAAGSFATGQKLPQGVKKKLFQQKAKL